MNVTLKRLASRGLTVAHRPLGKWRLRQDLARASKPLRVELGAWTTRRVGWIATDVHWRCHAYLDATRSWPVTTSSISYLFSDNVIEHVDMAANRTLFREALRVLEPGGKIRIVTPDVRALAETYLGGSEVADPLLGELRDDGYRVFHQVDVLRFAFQDDGHHLGYLWDFDSLAAELQAVGFVDVVQCEPGESSEPDLRGLELRVDTPVARIMLVVEAAKQSE